MFSISKEKLIDSLSKMQRKACSYDMNIPLNPPSFCDCKYGYDGKKYGENTGCPELRLVVHILENMTDHEYASLFNRKFKDII